MAVLTRDRSRFGESPLIIEGLIKRPHTAHVVHRIARSTVQGLCFLVFEGQFSTGVRQYIAAADSAVGGPHLQGVMERVDGWDLVKCPIMSGNMLSPSETSVKPTHAG